MTKREYADDKEAWHRYVQWSTDTRDALAFDSMRGQLVCMPKAFDWFPYDESVVDEAERLVWFAESHYPDFPALYAFAHRPLGLFRAFDLSTPLRDKTYNAQHTRHTQHIDDMMALCDLVARRFGLAECRTPFCNALILTSTEGGGGGGGSGSDFASDVCKKCRFLPVCDRCSTRCSPEDMVFDYADGGATCRTCTDDTSSPSGTSDSARTAPRAGASDATAAAATMPNLSRFLNVHERINATLARAEEYTGLTLRACRLHPTREADAQHGDAAHAASAAAARSDDAAQVDNDEDNDGWHVLPNTYFWARAGSSLRRCWSCYARGRDEWLLRAAQRRRAATSRKVQ